MSTNIRLALAGLGPLAPSHFWDTLSGGRWPPEVVLLVASFGGEPRLSPLAPAAPPPPAVPELQLPIPAPAAAPWPPSMPSTPAPAASWASVLRPSESANWDGSGRSRARERQAYEASVRELEVELLLEICFPYRAYSPGSWWQEYKRANFELSVSLSFAG